MGRSRLLDGNSSIGFRGVQSHEEQIDNLLIDEVVITPDVFFIDLQTGSRALAPSLFIPQASIY